jgi:hypothetical protein
MSTVGVVDGVVGTTPDAAVPETIVKAGHTTD